MGGWYLFPIPLEEKPILMTKRSHRSRAKQKRRFKAEALERIREGFVERCLKGGTAAGALEIPGHWAGAGEGVGSCSCSACTG